MGEKQNQILAEFTKALNYLDIVMESVSEDQLDCQSIKKRRLMRRPYY